MNSSSPVPTTWFDIPQEGLFAELESLRQEGYDRLPIGAIVLSPAGLVVTYNAAEAAFARKDPADVLGRHFFREIAPCARVCEFAGIIEGTSPGSAIDRTFLFTFRFRHGWRQANIRLVRDASASALTYIFVSPGHFVRGSNSRVRA